MYITDEFHFVSYDLVSSNESLDLLINAY